MLDGMKTIVFTHDAAKQLDALPLEARTTITNALAGYAIDGFGDVKKLARSCGRIKSGRIFTIPRLNLV